MREIKFRAWNTLLNQFIEDFESKYLIEVLNTDLFIINQFTGLQDKNGVDIYCGDTFNFNGEKYIVEWMDDSCRYVLTTGLGYDTRNCFDLTCDSIYFNEISGNIHQ